MSNDSQRVLLLTTVRSYRLEAFADAAARLGLQTVIGLDIPPELADQWPGAWPLSFDDIAASTQSLVNRAADAPIAAILAVDDSGSLLAAAASQALGLSHNRPEAAAAARDKHLMRQVLAAAGMPSPRFQLFNTADDPELIAATMSYPVVVKPLNLNGSRGVMRADKPEQLVASIARLRPIIQPAGNARPRPFLIETYIPGSEVSLEGLLSNGELQVLALFDKPDPLEGPFFEETIYVTPSRLPAEKQAAIKQTVARAAAALGLSTGPVHAELRLNEHGPWIVEVAGRSIGGLCSRTLRFGVDAPLEELILRQATGMSLPDVLQRPGANGVMMIPVPAAGILRQVSGREAAAAVPGVEGVEISAPLNYPLHPLPEGDAYLGFIFARGESPHDVEQALRQAHAKLRFEIEPLLLLQPL